MNVHWQEEMARWLSAQAEACSREMQALRQQSREDEAVFQRIRGNVFTLSGAVLNAAGSQADPAGFFRQRMERIPSAWQAAWQQAEAHGDTEQMHLEQIKLQAAEEIREKLRQMEADV